MIFSDQHVRVWLYRHATDMRKSFRGLIGLVKTQMKEDPVSGSLFVFINRKKTYMKVLYYARGGFCIWSKKLTQGQFAFSEHAGSNKKAMSWQQLQWLIEGMEVEKVRYRKRFELPTKTPSSSLQSASIKESTGTRPTP